MDKESLERVIDEIKKAALLDQRTESESLQKSAREYLHVIDAFEVPKLRYRHAEKAFTRYVVHQFCSCISVSEQCHLLAPAIEKAQVFKERYNVIYQRIMRNDAFSSAGFSATTSDDFCQVRHRVQDSSMIDHTHQKS